MWVWISRNYLLQCKINTESQRAVKLTPGLTQPDAGLHVFSIRWLRKNTCCDFTDAWSFRGHSLVLKKWIVLQNRVVIISFQTQFSRYFKFAFHIWRTQQEIGWVELIQNRKKLRDIKVKGGAWVKDAGGGDMRYKYHCRNHRFLLTAHCHQKPLNLSNFTSSSESSTWMTPLFHSEIFVFFCYFQFCMLQTSSPHPLTLCGFSGLFPMSPCGVLTWAHSDIFQTFISGSGRKNSGKCQLTWTFVFSHKAPPEHSWKRTSVHIWKQL